MRNIVLFVILWLSAGGLSAQRLIGVVYDKVNREPVIGAHVYLDRSSLFATTNANGRFVITVHSVVNLPLVVSHVSYQTTTVSHPFTSLPDTIFVEERENALSEVVVSTGRYSRQQLLRAFRNEFLGSSSVARSCMIENEDKIEIWFNPSTRKLMASCEEPIVIHNRYLGYKIYLTLEKFEAQYSSRFLVGIPVVLLISFV